MSPEFPKQFYSAQNLWSTPWKQRIKCTTCSGHEEPPIPGQVRHNHNKQAGGSGAAQLTPVCLEVAGSDCSCLTGDLLSYWGKGAGYRAVGTSMLSPGSPWNMHFCKRNTNVSLLSLSRAQIYCCYSLGWIHPFSAGWNSPRSCLSHI